MALDYSPWLEQFASVTSILVHYFYSYWLTALEPSARIEIRTLPTSVQFSFAVRARAIDCDVRWGLCSARSAFYSLAKCHHSWRTWAFTIVRLWARSGLRFWPLRLAFVVPVTALPIFTVAHLLFLSGRFPTQPNHLSPCLRLGQCCFGKLQRI